MEKIRNKYTYAGVLAVLFIGSMIFITVKYLHQVNQVNDASVAEHIEKLGALFKQINEHCKIIGFRRQKNYIDFLNVKAFEGSIVGSMSLEEPQNWKGPYLSESYTSGGREYQVVRAKRGYYILPGDGVRLANGKVIGKTLVIGPDSDVEQMMNDSKALSSKGRPLAARVSTVRDQNKNVQEVDATDIES
jgi:hypothetical protein